MDKVTSISEKVFDILTGEWIGEGIGHFPTIDDFEYTEVLSFKKDKQRPFLHYKQETVLKATLGQTQKPSHIESGFLIFLEEDYCEINNAQDGGRMEFLKLSSLSIDNDIIEMEFTSSSILNDDRIISSYRKFKINKNEKTLHYEMEMATDKVSKRQNHLRAKLKKV